MNDSNNHGNGGRLTRHSSICMQCRWGRLAIARYYFATHETIHGGNRHEMLWTVPHGYPYEMYSTLMHHARKMASNLILCNTLLTNVFFLVCCI
jgi:hypothetical protein